MDKQKKSCNDLLTFTKKELKIIIDKAEEYLAFLQQLENLNEIDDNVLDTSLLN